MENERWVKLEEHNAFLGDLKEPYGRRILMVISNGVGVYAKCTVENYYLMKDDFEKLLTDFEFVLAVKMENGIPFFSRETELLFDTEMMEEISEKLTESLV